MMLMLPGSLDSDWLTWFSTWLDMKDILFIADLGLLNEDDFLAMLFLFHRGVTRTLAGFGEDGVLVGVDGDDGVLPPLVDGEDDDEVVIVLELDSLKDYLLFQCMSYLWTFYHLNV